MFDLQKIDDVLTMSSLEMVKLINSTRKEGDAELTHSDFLKKVPKVLGVIDAGNFSSIYKDSMNRDQPCYNFPKREACLMAMSYSYELQAAVFDRWQELETKQAKPMTQIELILASAQQLADQDRRISSLEEDVKKISAKKESLSEGISYFTILAYASYKGITVDLTAAKDLGKRATALSKEQGMPIDRVKDPRFGYVNSYHESILDSMICELL